MVKSWKKHCLGARSVRFVKKYHGNPTQKISAWVAENSKNDKNYHGESQKHPVLIPPIDPGEKATHKLLLRKQHLVFLPHFCVRDPGEFLYRNSI